MKTFVAALSRILAPTTATTVYAVLRTMMAAAVDDGLIPENPCARVPLPRIDPRVLEPLPAAKVAAIAAAITPRYEVAVWLAAGAGLREGEVFGLLASRVQFLQRRLLVEEQGQKGRLVPPKTKASKAAVPLDDLILAKISAHLARWPIGKSGLVMTNRCGRMVQRSSFGWCWREAVEAAGLPEGTRFHDLRHFLREHADRRRAVPQGGPGADAARHPRRDDGHVRAPVPRSRSAGPRRGALDRAFGTDVPGECPQTGS